MTPGRNERCPCGSGRKYKHCHGAAAPGAPAAPPSLEEQGLEHVRQGRLAEAEKSFLGLIAQSADAAAGHGHLGLVLLLQGRAVAAAAALQRAVALDPERAGAWANLGAALKEVGREDEAEAALRRALQLDDGIAAAHSNLGTVLMRRHDPAAEHAFNRALALDPGFGDAHFNRASLLRGQGRIGEATTALRRAITLNPQHLPSWHNLLLGLLYADDVKPAEVLAWHRRFEALMGLLQVQPLARHSPADSRDADRPLRVGLVSPDLRQHSVAFFLEPLLQHARAGLQFHAYHDSPVFDATSRRLRSRIAQWHDVAQLSDDALAERIAADGIDVLVDLAGHTGLRLPVFARRPAALQLAWLGYPASTGLSPPSMHGRITDALCDPAAHEALHSERLLRLPASYFCYAPAPDAPEPAMLPLHREGMPTFGSFNAVPKLSAFTLSLWARVLGAVPNARLLLKAAGLADVSTCRRIRDAFAGHGIDPQRITLRPWNAGTAHHLQAYGEIDVALDTLPYNGATTTCEALWMGVPVVTLAGDRPQGRMGASLLHAAGCSEWIARDADAFVATACALVADADALAAQRAGLRRRLRGSPLLDGARFAADWETAVRQEWREAVASMHQGERG